MKSIFRLSVLLVLTALAVLPAFAQRLEKKASGKGQVNPLTGCSDGSSNAPCVIFTQTSPTTGQWTNILFGGGQDGPYDLFLVPTSQNVTFQLTGSNVTFGSFLCGLDPTMTSRLNRLCTNIDDSADTASFLNPNPSAPDASKKVTFGFLSGAAGLPADWVFYFTAGDAKIVTGSTTVPEPGTIALLACGLFAMVMLGRKRLQTQNS
jgi:hypothetical protein